MLTKIRADLWETEVESPFPGLTTHAYLWTPPSGRNVLFYSTSGDGDHDEIERLGGIAHQYLSHQDEAGPALHGIAARFGNRLHAPAGDAERIRKTTEADVWFDARHVDGNGIEVIPTPGHTPGSTCFLVPGVDGSSYLFTGDTVFVSGEGRWTAGNLPFSDADALTTSLELLAALHPDLVVSSAFGRAGATILDPAGWATHTKEAIDSIRR